MITIYKQDFLLVVYKKKTDLEKITFLSIKIVQDKKGFSLAVC